MNKNISFLLLSAALAACILQVAVARPVRRSSESEQFRFAIQSPLSGHFIRMLSNGSIDTSIDYRPLNTQWFIHMNENGFGFESCAYRGHYLSIATLGSATVLFSQDGSAPLTRSDMERILAAENRPVGVTGEEEPQFSVLSDWVIETTASLQTRVKAAAQGRDCYLAVNAFGEPIADLCNVNASGESVIVHFKVIF